MEDYTLYDPETDQTFIAKIPSGQRGVYDLDHMKRFRLLNFLKKQNQATCSSSVSCPGAATQLSHEQADIAVTSTGVTRAEGETGAVWKGKTTNSLIQRSLPYRKWLREVVPQSIWQCISDDLYHKDKLDYSWMQIRAKFKSLKKQFKSAKTGKLRGNNWEHFWLMVYIYDEPINSSNVTLCPPGFNLENLEANRANSCPLVPAVDIASENNLLGGDTEPSLVSGSKDTTLHPYQEVNDIPNVDVTSTPLASGSRCTLSQEFSEPNSFEESLAGSGSRDTQDIPSNANFFKDIATFMDLSGPEFSSTMVPRSPPKESLETGSIGKPLVTRSPSKKSLKTGNGGKVCAPKTPPTTPNRKRSVAQSALVMSLEATNLLVKELLKHKELIVKEHVPLSVWKEIGNVLVVAGHSNITWEICREKYSVMNKFYRRIIPSNGILGADKWRHYDSFMEINSCVENTESDGKKLWIPTRVLALIALYKDRLQRFQREDSSDTDAELYAEIALELNTFEIDDKIVTGKQCHEEMDRLKSKYRYETDREKGTGATASVWPFYSQMAEILGGTASIDAPFLASAGVGAEYKVRGQELKEVERNSRTRPNISTVSTVAANRKPPKPLKKLFATERTLQQQQSSQAQPDSVAEEIRLSRVSQEQRHKDRMLVMNTLVNVLERKL